MFLRRVSNFESDEELIFETRLKNCDFKKHAKIIMV